jgi:hypothetical protein
MRSITVGVGPLQAASANAIVTSVTPTSGQSLTLTSSPFVMDTPRRVLVTYGTEGTARTLTLTGTSLTNQTQSETITVPVGSGGTVSSVLDYATVTSIVSNSSFTSAITVGTSGVAGSAWVRFDDWAIPMVTSQSTVTGTVNYTIQVTMDDPNGVVSPVSPAAVTWVNWPDTVFQAATGTFQSTVPFSPTFARVVLNSGSGSVKTTFLQSGSVTY